MSDEADRTELPPDRFTSLWRRIKEHRIAQWTVGYIAVAYGIQHAVILTSESFEWPNMVARVSMLLLVLGLPIAMTLAWYHGERTARRISSGELAVVSVVLLGISFAFYLFVRPAGDIAPTVQQASLGPAAVNGTALAVLPFANVSGDANQEFFSDGMTDEIMTALAKVAALRVVGRESAFQFKGKNQDNRAIGRALGARYLVEGSVRKAGTRVRITAQLVRADDGVSLWTEGYDRDLKDVFAVQEDVSQAIAGALRVPLGLRQGETLVANRTGDLESYQQYLRARALVRARAMDEAVVTLEGVVARDPGYAPAWALLPFAYTLAFAYSGIFDHLTGASIEEPRRARQDLFDKVEKASHEAIRLDPKQPGGYVGLARVESTRGNRIVAEGLYRQALALDPGDPETLDDYSQWLVTVGRVKDSLRLREQLRMQEPFVPIYNATTANILHADRQNEAARRMLEAIPPGGGTVGERRNVLLARVYAATGRYGEAAELLLAVPHDQNRTSRQSVVEAARLLRIAPAKVSAPDALPGLPDELSFVYLYVGALGRVMDDDERVFETVGNLGFVNWGAEFAPVRKTERFKTFVRKIGLVDYWRSKGWPDLCHPVGTDDFACN